ncbi:hypothetical protein B0H12DRAFT_1159765 [Mycena haematopus]|nr:hypothetical protein B0H12DRAFT_1159765 [Mycena haematopus]
MRTHRIDVSRRQSARLAPFAHFERRYASSPHSFGGITSCRDLHHAPQHQVSGVRRPRHGGDRDPTADHSKNHCQAGECAPVYLELLGISGPDSSTRLDLIRFSRAPTAA